MTDLYDKPGKLLSVKSYTPAKSINASFEQSGACVKVMQWNTTDNFSPYSDVSVLNITYPEIR